MILVDTSIWIDHLHHLEPSLVDALNGTTVVQHPMVIGELALGSLCDRGAFLELLADLPKIQVATHGEVMHLVEARHLHGQGLGFVDAHLLASVLLRPGTRLWTRDKRLLKSAEGLGIAYSDG